MKKKYIYYLLVPFTILFLQLVCLASNAVNTPERSNRRNKNKQFIAFNYLNEDLVTIINYLAGLKGVNIILPQEGNTINAKVTWRLDHKVSLKEAWEILYTLLDVAGYEMHPEGDFYRVVKSSKETTARMPSKTFINISPSELPQSDEQIKYVYFLANIKLGEGPNEEIPKVLSEILPANTSFKVDSESNALILMGNSFDIKEAMQIVQQLDQVTHKESMEIIRLRYADPEVIANLFNENILSTSVNRYHLDTTKKPESLYFSYLKMYALPRLNAVIVLGKESSIDRVRSFIQGYLDIEQGTGNSILHVFQLQYLDVEQFKLVLENVVRATQPSGSATQQAQAAPGEAPPVRGTERFFENVIISVDKPKDIPESATTQGEGARKAPTPYYGGNKLLIAAKNEDWLRLKQLIEELDTPRSQVYIEVLIADLTISDQRALSSIVRNPEKIPLPHDVNFQSSQTLQPNNGLLPNQFTPTLPPNPQPLTIGVIENPAANSDLLRFNAYDPSTGNKSLTDAGLSSSLFFAQPGTTAISLNDNNGSTWGILQALKIFDRNKILSHPHVMATANQPAVIEISEKRLVVGDATGSNNLQIRNVPIVAKLQVQLTPRISPANTVNLQIAIDISEFIEGQTNARIIRTIETNVNIKNGDILTLGGLIKDDTNRARTGVPILQDIPIFGWLFKGKSADEARTNLTVFISPTIIEPRLRKGAGKITQHYMEVAKLYATEGELFQSLRDPITRWYFKPDPAPRRIVDNFLAKDELLKSKTTPGTPPTPSLIEKEQNNLQIPPPPQTVCKTKEHSDADLKALVAEIENPFKEVAPGKADLQS